MSKNNQVDLIEFPVGNANDLKANTHFFTEVFGWNYTTYGDEYADTKDSGLTVGVNASDNNRYTKPLAVIYVNDLEKTKNKIILSGGKILIDIYSFPGGKRFHFSDPSGNEIAVWSEN